MNFRKHLRPGPAALALSAIALYLANASWLAPRPTGEPALISHRGVHQLYDRTDIGRDDCTATRIHPPVHDFIENTLPSMRAAFEAGADALELDVHPTRDGDFVVFHDWTLDCRTEGSGVTRQQTLDYLQGLDLGYGYTADGGRTFPLRGKGIGMMPSLKQVFKTFPDREFIINIKSNDPREADWLAAYLERHGLLDAPAFAVYGGEKPVRRWNERFPAAAMPTRAQVKECTKNYVLMGWSGFEPDACKAGAIMVPLNRTHLFWGWPNRFFARMQSMGTRVLILGKQDNRTGIAGVEHIEQLSPLPASFTGHIWVEAIESVGPYLAERQAINRAP